MPNITQGFSLSSTVYDKGKFLVQILIPASSSLYFALSGIWGLPATEEVVGTLAVVATFLGAILGISSRNYNSSDAKYDGNIVVAESDEGKKLYSLELNSDPEDLDQKSELLFKVAPDLPEGD